MSSKLSATWPWPREKMNGILSREHELRARHVQMPDRHGDILRLGRAAEHVNHLEALAQLHEIAEILERARATAAGRVHDVRRSRRRAERDASRVERHVPLGIDGVQRDVVRRGRERRGDEPAVEPHDLRRLVDLGAGVA